MAPGSRTGPLQDWLEADDEKLASVAQVTDARAALIDRCLSLSTQ